MATPFLALLGLAARLLLAGAAAPAAPFDLVCPANCTAPLQAALFSAHAHIRVHPPAAGGPATLGSPHHSTRLLANGSHQLVELMPGLELRGFLNNTFYPSTGATKAQGYDPALVSLELTGTNLTLLGGGGGGSGTVLRHITSSAAGRGVTMQGLRFISPGWDGCYVRGAVGLTMRDCLFDRPYRNGISVIDAVDMLAENCSFSNALPNGTGRVSPMAGVDLEPNRPTDRLHNITFRRCRALNNSGAGFQAFPG
eukprot:SAG22_NODE_367_length_11613_cov_11.955011_5_plen_254_part_00